MKITEVIKNKINQLAQEETQIEFEKTSGLNLNEVLLKNQFSLDDLIAICKGLDVELVEFFADPMFELKNLA